MSAQDTYNSMWKITDDLVKKNGLPQTALAQVEKIYQKAKKEKQYAQVIKALIYKVSLADQVEENVASANVLQIEKEIRTAEPVPAAILHSLLADTYKSYFIQNRYKLYNRTQTVAAVAGNLDTWTIADFQNQIASEYGKSLAAEKLLQQTSLQAYDAIITKGNTPNLRPTLFDLLANRALAHFRNEERDISKAAYAFEIDDPAYFSPATAFATLKITSSDTLSLHHKALLIYQKLILLHTKDNKPDALIDADISRIQLIHQFGVMENKESLYMGALQNLVNRYGMIPAATQAAYLLAQLHARKAAEYKPLTDSSNRFEYNEAERICEKVASQPATSEGKSNCMVLLSDIRRRTMNLETEKVNLPGKPFRTLVQYRNFTQLFLRVLLLPEGVTGVAGNNEEAYWKALLALKPVRSWSQPLPATNDHQTHGAEITVNALPVGANLPAAHLHCRDTQRFFDS